MSIQLNTGNRNLLDAAVAHGSFKTFTKAVEQAGMGETLRGPGPFTVFAPTDAAFAKLPAGKLDELLKPENKTELVSILNYHVVSGRKSAADIGSWEKAETVNGQSAPIKLLDNGRTGSETVIKEVKEGVKDNFPGLRRAGRPPVKTSCP